MLAAAAGGRGLLQVDQLDARRRYGSSQPSVRKACFLDELIPTTASPVDRFYLVVDRISGSGRKLLCCDQLSQRQKRRVCPCDLKTDHLKPDALPLWWHPIITCHSDWSFSFKPLPPRFPALLKLAVTLFEANIFSFALFWLKTAKIFLLFSCEKV